MTKLLGTATVDLCEGPYTGDLANATKRPDTLIRARPSHHESGRAASSTRPGPSIRGRHRTAATAIGSRATTDRPAPPRPLVVGRSGVPRVGGRGASRRWCSPEEWSDTVGDSAE